MENSFYPEDLENLANLFDAYQGLKNLAKTDPATQDVANVGTEIFNVLSEDRLATPVVAMALFAIGSSVSVAGAKLYDFGNSEAKENAPAATSGLIGASMIFAAGKIMDYYAGV